MHTKLAAYLTFGREKRAYTLADAVSVLRRTKNFVMPRAANRWAGAGDPQGLFALTRNHASAYDRALFDMTQRAALAANVPADIQAALAKAAQGARVPKAPVPYSVAAGRVGPSGAIIRGEHDPLSMTRRMYNLPDPKFTPDQHRMFNSIVRGHEWDELGAPRNNPGLRSEGHLHPRVIFREHNRVVTLPEEYAPVRNFLTRVRSQQLKNAPAGFTYGQGPRLSRHRIRDLSNQYAQSFEAALTSDFKNTDPGVFRRQLGLQPPVQLKTFVPSNRMSRWSENARHKKFNPPTPMANSATP